MTYEEFNALVPLTRETYGKLGLYHDLLVKWQKHVNLIAPSTLGEIWERHILDSAWLQRYIKPLPGKTGRVSIGDIGTGAGFPGLVLAILGDYDVTLIESDRKKCEFLREAARVTGVNVTLANQRAEEVRGPTFDIVVSRATAKLETLLEWAQPLMNPASFCLFHKGENWATELDAAKLRQHGDFEILPAMPSANGCIIKTTNLSKRTG